MDQRNRTRREGGFTLIELISVIVILGILAAVVVPKYTDMTQQAKRGAAKGAVSEGIAALNIAIAKYTMDKSAAPTTMTDLTTQTPQGSTKEFLDPAYTGAGHATGDYTIKMSGTNGAVEVLAWLTNDGAYNEETGGNKTFTPDWQK